MSYRGTDIPAGSRCALDALELLSKKWHPIVVVVLQHHGPLGFSDLLDAIPDVSGKVLSESLETLQDAGLIRRRVVSESPLRVEYSLSDPGTDMELVFDALAEWGHRHLETVTATVVLADGDRRITNMYSQWLADRYTLIRAHDEEELAECLDDSVDVVLLDGNFPGTTLRDVVSNHREDSRIVVLVDDRPPFDLLELECDDLLRKPLERETAIETVGRQIAALDDSDDGRRLSSLSARRSLFETVYRRERLETSDAYQTVCDRTETLAEDVDE